MFVSKKPAWFMASYAIPPVMAPSPMIWKRINREKEREREREE